MAAQDTQMQARIYVYDLNNTAKEFGFKTDEGWELNVATQEEKTTIEKRFHPTISIKVKPEASAEIFGLVKGGLSQSASNIPNNQEVAKRNTDEQQYLVAFNPKRARH
ncbi:hypothetical protein [Mucilaginibacter myungsuensis]|uniref:Uncharacterized protein n=1 Tax=Mucilaginibacter myungsuensis TaxID=649104 RepID=A0A929L145_9SPHI|nr:hypothetical protein [Mucilaginibacter myungsuensis]MBE9664330.1 hypothetical protein [Mucilaginibacter myungsuensis]MDN3597039.1 hypothetical protein [Mucilaginibacter myungsuensis]